MVTIIEEVERAKNIIEKELDISFATGITDKYHNYGRAILINYIYKILNPKYGKKALTYYSIAVYCGYSKTQPVSVHIRTFKDRLNSDPFFSYIAAKLFSKICEVDYGDLLKERGEIMARLYEIDAILKVNINNRLWQITD